jgi:2-dehydropantoate 2-reductase
MTTDSYKNICILGVGGVGGYFGGKIAYFFSQNKQHDHKICFVARGKHLEKIKTDGLILDTDDGEFVCKPDFATDDISAIPSPDLVLLCCKSYDLEAAVKQLAPKLNNETIILPLLNGVDIYERIRKITNKGFVLPSCVYVVTHLEKPGLVIQRGSYADIISGSDPQHPEFVSDTIISFLTSLGIRFKWSDDPLPAIWEKYIFIASYGMVTAYSGKHFALVNSDDRLIGMVADVIKEIQAIAGRKNVRLPDDILEKTLKKGINIPPDSRTSYQRDVETKGRLNESDIYGEAIERMGEEFGIPTPVTSYLYAEIQNRFK